MRPFYLNVNGHICFCFVLFFLSLPFVVVVGGGDGSSGFGAKTTIGYNH